MHMGGMGVMDTLIEMNRTYFYYLFVVCKCLFTKMVNSYQLSKQIKLAHISPEPVDKKRKPTLL